ncbi:hypothetical protein [Paenibacillus sp. UNC451MF]|nr:hypothetical protein [Paenibacillus sp. UNC451MF]
MSIKWKRKILINDPVVLDPVQIERRKLLSFKQFKDPKWRQYKI